MAKNANARVSPFAHHSQKANLSPIPAISPPNDQSQKYKRLTQAVRHRGLTVSLEILAARGIKENLAIFIANLQSLEVAS